MSLKIFLLLLGLTSPILGQKPEISQPKAWIGISFLDVPTAKIPAEYKHRTVNGAVQIQQVFKGASGEQAGLQPGDFILAVDGILLDGRGVLLETVNKKKVGDILELKIGRQGGIFSQKMALSPRPEDMRSLTKMLIGSQAPELDGAYYSKDCGSLRTNRGKAIVLDFWATWCQPCIMTLPLLEDLYQKYHSKGLLIIGISSEPLPALKSFQQEHGHNYPLFNDTSQSTQREYMAYAYPTLVYIDRYGIIQRVETGAPSKEHIEGRIRELLGI